MEPSPYFEEVRSRAKAALVVQADQVAGQRRAYEDDVAVNAVLQSGYTLAGLRLGRAARHARRDGVILGTAVDLGRRLPPRESCGPHG